MTWEIALIFALTVVALVLFIADRFPIDQVALAIPVVLLAAGILSPEEAVAGFSHPATVTVAAMLALSLGLVKTGAVDEIGRWVRRIPVRSSRIKLMVLCGVVACISPFLNNTAVVAVFIPVFLSLAREAEEPPSLYLIPLSFSAILGGTVTVLGTSTNLIVHGMAREQGLTEIGIFSITPLGLIYLGVGLLFLFTIGRRLLPHRVGETDDLATRYGVRDFVSELTVGDESSAAGKTLAELGWHERYEVWIRTIERTEFTDWAPRGTSRIQSGDILHAAGETEALLKMADKEGLSMPSEPEDADVNEEVLPMVEVLIPPASWLAGRTVKSIRFRQRYGASVLGIHRHGRSSASALSRVQLEVGDLLMVQGTAEALDSLANEPALMPLGAVTPPPTGRPRALVATAILVGVVAVAAVGIVPIVAAAITGVVVLLFTGCLRPSEMYAELDWKVIFLIAGLLPLGTGMANAGAAEWLVAQSSGFLLDASPMLLVAVFYLATALLTELMSNNATAVVLTPVALQVAAQSGMNPYALLVALMFGASASFMTPIGYQTNTLIYGPGGYQFKDYLRIGIPLNLLLVGVASLLIPVLWPSP